MAYNQHQANVRNFLIGLTPNECREVLRQAREDGDGAKAGYIVDWLEEWEREANKCEGEKR